jgi:hypothetical protein
MLVHDGKDGTRWHQKVRKTVLRTVVPWSSPHGEGVKSRVSQYFFELVFLREDIPDDC